MCFNETASFAGAAVVGVVGVATLAQVKERREIAWAALPLAFAAHQLLEGLTWMQLHGQPEASLAGPVVRLWVLYAWALLPLWLPLSVRLIEPDPKRRSWLLPFLGLGAATMVVLMVAVFAPDVEVRNVGGNLDYVMPVLDAGWLVVPYVICTCLAPLLSSSRWVQLFGMVNLVAVGVSLYIEVKDFSSIWCTFAAFLSVIVLVDMRDRRGHLRAPAPATA